MIRNGEVGCCLNVQDLEETEVVTSLLDSTNKQAPHTRRFRLGYSPVYRWWGRGRWWWEFNGRMLGNTVGKEQEL
jgi:hypothetical protein